MDAMLSLFRGTILLKNETFNEMKAMPDVLRKGLIFLLAIGLIVGFVNGIVGFVQGVTTNPAEQMASFEQIMKFIPGAEDFMQYFRVGARIGTRIREEAKAPLPSAIQILFEQLGAAFSLPFSWLGSLLLYSVLVHFFAKLLGGRAPLAQMLGLSFLAVAPRILNVLNFVPFLPLLLGPIVFVWGVIIYVKTTAVAQEMSTGKAFLAAILPALIGLIVAPLFGGVIGLIVSAVSAG